MARATPVASTRVSRARVVSAQAKGKNWGKAKKVVLAYSGGLDTSIILKWLQDEYGCEVVTFTADLGQVRPSMRCPALMARMHFRCVCLCCDTRECVFVHVLIRVGKLSWIKKCFQQDPTFTCKSLCKSALWSIKGAAALCCVPNKTACKAHNTRHPKPTRWGSLAHNAPLTRPT